MSSALISVSFQFIASFSCSLVELYSPTRLVIGDQDRECQNKVRVGIVIHAHSSASFHFIASFSFSPVCEAISGLRDSLGLKEFFGMCKSRGLGQTASYSLYLCGFALDESNTSMKEYRERGDNLDKMRKEWLSI